MGEPLALYREEINAERFWARVAIAGPDDCWHWRGSRKTTGYGHFQVCRKPRRTHRVAFALEYGAVPYDAYVLHHCDQPSCVNPYHLWLGTQSDNIRDCQQKGRHRGGRGRRGEHRIRQRHGVCCGERHGMAKLTTANVLEIRQRWHGGERQAALAREFGVSRPAMFQIVHGRSWCHVKEAP